MSLDNFIPTIWSANFIEAFRKASVLTGPGVINRNWEGDIREKGDKVKINQIADPTISDYVKNSSTLTFEVLEDAAAFLEVNQCKSFSFAIDDVDKAQGSVGIMQLAMSRSAYKMKDTVDQYIAGLYTKAGVTSGLGTTNTPLTITAKGTAGSNISVMELFATVAKALDEVNCPTDGRFAVIPPWLHAKAVLASVMNIYTTDQVAMRAGLVGRIMGFDVYVSNNLTNTAGAKHKTLWGINQAITYAEQVNKVEALRLQASFSDALKGLMLYGATVIQPSGLACATCSSAAET